MQFRCLQIYISTVSKDIHRNLDYTYRIEGDPLKDFKIIDLPFRPIIISLLDILLQDHSFQRRPMVNHSSSRILVIQPIPKTVTIQDIRSLFRDYSHDIVDVKIVTDSATNTYRAYLHFAPFSQDTRLMLDFEFADMQYAPWDARLCFSDRVWNSLENKEGESNQQTSTSLMDSRSPNPHLEQFQKLGKACQNHEELFSTEEGEKTIKSQIQILDGILSDPLLENQPIKSQMHTTIQEKTMHEFPVQCYTLLLIGLVLYLLIL